MWAWIKKWFKKQPPQAQASKPQEMGGGMQLNLERVLRRLDPNSNLPNAVRVNAIKTLTSMSGKEIHMAASTGNVKQARKINSTLQSVEQLFPKAVESMSKEERAALTSQRSRAASRVARLENRLTNSNGEASRYGALPNPETEKRRGKLKG